ncbi:uncharacterized protein (TIGR02594 family) [Sinorhizobium fredii]|uniref:TIGR02594 family protein n=1 Tax=Rhizobium fredii TaxID=380 RepID=UPI003518E854
MATDLERLVVQLSGDIRKFEKEMAKARGVSNREFNAIEKRAKQLNRNLDAIGKNAARALVAPLGGVVAALGVREIIQYADAWTKAGNALKVAGVPAEQMSGTLDRLFNIAQGAGTDLNATVTLFSRLSQSAKELGADQEQLFRFTEGVGDALKVAGTDAQSASGALLQLSQALGGAVVRAEEFNAINEGARPILQAVAAGMEEAGGSVSKLRELVLDGAVTSKAFFESFLRGSAGLKAQASQASTTFEQAFTKIQNAFTRYIGQTDEGLGASQRLIQGLEALADNFDATADTAIAFASILAAGLLGRSIGGMIAKIGLAGVALAKFVSQLRAAQAVARSGLLLGGLAGAAGPVGAAIGVAAAAALYFATSSDKASTSGKRYAEVLAEIEAAANKTAPAVEKLGEEITEKHKFEAAEDVETALDQVTEKTAEAVAQFDHLLRSVDRTSIPPEALREIEKLRDGIADGSVKAEDAKQKLYELANTDYRFEAVAKAFDPILTALDNAIKALDVFQKKSSGLNLGSVADDPRAAGFRQLSERDAADRQRQSFLQDRTTEASRSEFQRELDTRTDQILKAAEDTGIALSEGAARIQAETELAAERSARATETATGEIRKSLINTARQFEGFSENAPNQRGALTDFFKSANQNVDPKMTAWCAAFVNAVLATNGLPGTGALNARSFLDYGTATQDPQPGDLVILKRGSGNVQGHVGFFMGNAEGGGVRVLGGNQGDAVNERTFRSEDVLGFRQVPGGASESLAKDVSLRREQLQIIRETMAALAEETAGISAETTMLGASNAERERERVVRETLNELQRQGVTITDEVRAAVEAEANARYGAVAAYDSATEAAERLRQKQEELAAVNDDIGYAFQSSIKGLISDLVQGKSATEALYNAVSRLADRLLDIALDQLFAGIFTGGASGGGLLGGLFGGFESGGYTGNIAKNKPAGVVHGREFVVNAEATKKNRALLEAINAGMSGYAEGGYVVPRIGGARVATSGVAAAPSVDARTQIVNTFDAQSFLSQALSTQAGVKTILNVVRAQPGAFKAAMNG